MRPSHDPHHPRPLRLASAKAPLIAYDATNGDTQAAYEQALAAAQAVGPGALVVKETTTVERQTVVRVER